MAKILAIGSILIEDHFYLDKTFSEYPSGVCFPESRQTFVSSKAINASRILQCKHTVDYFGIIHSNEGSMVEEALCRYGIGSTHIILQNTLPTGKVVITTDSDGQDRLIVYFGAHNALTDYAEKLVSILNEYDALYIAFDFPNDVLTVILQNFSGNVFIDLPSKRFQLDTSLVTDNTFLFPNRLELSFITKRKINTLQDAEDALVTITTNATIVSSLDELGAVLYKNRITKCFSVKNKAVVDSTAAGDIFRGVVVSEILQGVELENAIQVANHVAGETVEVRGVEESIEKALELVRE